jgi:hypothetical protein
MNIATKIPIYPINIREYRRGNKKDNTETLGTQVTQEK